MHDFAIKLGTVNESQHEEDQQATLKRLELLLITDVSYQNFLFKTVDFWYDVTIFELKMILAISGICTESKTQFKVR